jgi:hypothetical protein
MRLFHVIGRDGAAHFGRDPAGFKCIGEHVRPAPRDRECQHRVVQFALRIGCRSVPTALLPHDIVEIGIGVMVHAGTEKHETLRPLDQCRQDESRQRIDGEDMR